MVRKLYYKLIERIESPEALVITGMRRVGKTMVLKEVYKNLVSQNKVFLDLENPIHQKYFEADNYDAIKYQLEVLGIDTSRRAYIFLDEIQHVRHLPSIVKYLSDHYHYKFFLTGSASFYLKNLFSESLAGRKIIYELFPLDFEEFLMLKGEKLKVPTGEVTDALYETILPLYREYITYGGFPAVVQKTSHEEKKEALGDIFTAYFEKEVLQIGEFRNNQLMRDLILLLSSRVGSRIEVQKLASELGTTRVTINAYLAFLEGTYFLSLIAPFSTNRDIEIRGAKKVYMNDSGLVQYLGKVSFGAVLENAIFHQLRSHGDITYYQRKSGVEIDFIVDGTYGWEVKTRATMQDITRLTALIREIGLKKGTAVSFEQVKLPVIYGFQI